MKGMDLKNVKNVLVMCLGNTCRSPAAEGFIRRLAKERLPAAMRENIDVWSAGLNSYFRTAQPSSVKFVLELAGEDISGHAAHEVSEEDVRRADVVIVMERYMKDRLLSRFSRVPELASKIITLKEGAGFESGDIEDPYMEGDIVYKAIISEILDDCTAFVENWVKAISAATET